MLWFIDYDSHREILTWLTISSLKDKLAQWFTVNTLDFESSSLDLGPGQGYCITFLGRFFTCNLQI